MAIHASTYISLLLQLGFADSHRSLTLYSLALIEPCVTKIKPAPPAKKYLSKTSEKILLVHLIGKF